MFGGALVEVLHDLSKNVGGKSSGVSPENEIVVDLKGAEEIAH